MVSIIEKEPKEGARLGKGNEEREKRGRKLISSEHSKIRSASTKTKSLLLLVSTTNCINIVLNISYSVIN